MNSFLNVNTPISPFVHPETIGLKGEEKPRSFLIFKGDRFLPAEKITLYQKPDYFYFTSIFNEGNRFCVLLYSKRFILGNGHCKCVRDETGSSFFVFKKPFDGWNDHKTMEWSDLPYPIDVLMYIKEKKPIKNDR